ncbi:hypothetical protein ACLH3T_002445 [Flavobacterium psychrophilum]
MTYKQIVENYKKELEEKAEIIKNKIDIFYAENKDKEDVFYLVNKEFEYEIDDFKHKYSQSVPAILLGTIYDKIPYSNSLDIYLSLVNHQLDIYRKIISTDESLDALSEEQV